MLAVIVVAFLCTKNPTGNGLSVPGELDKQEHRTASNPESNASAIFDIVNTAAVEAQRGELMAALQTLHQLRQFPDAEAKQILAGTDVLDRAVTLALEGDEDAKAADSDAEDEAALSLFRQAVLLCEDARKFAGVSPIAHVALGVSSASFEDPWPNVVQAFEAEFRRRRIVLFGSKL